MTIKATGSLAASARVRYGAAAQAYPLGSLLTVMGRKTIPVLEENEEIQKMIRNVICSQPSGLKDDHQFDHPGDLMKSVIKLGTMTSKAFTKRDGAYPTPREVHEETIRDKVMSMLWTSVQIARMETIQDMQTTLSSCVGAASVKFDQAHASAVIQHDKMTDSLVEITTAVGNYRNTMGPQNHERDALVLECEKLWQFSTTSYVKRASLTEEKEQIDAEKAGVKTKSHTIKLLDDGTTASVEFTTEMRNAEFAALEVRNTAVRVSYNKEKKSIYTEMTGKDTVPTAQSITIME